MHPVDKMFFYFGVVLFIILLAFHVKADCDDSIEVMIAKEAISQGVSVDLALAVAKVESGYKQSAVSNKGAIGVFQVMPYHNPHLNDLQTNIHVGVYLLKQSLEKCADMGDYAVICYYNGIHRRPKHPSLHPYYKSIMAAMR